MYIFKILERKKTSNNIPVVIAKPEDVPKDFIDELML